MFLISQPLASFFLSQILISVPVNTNSGQRVLKLSCNQWTKVDDIKDEKICMVTGKV
jgi:hypothetical protein